MGSAGNFETKFFPKSTVKMPGPGTAPSAPSAYTLRIYPLCTPNPLTPLGPQDSPHTEYVVEGGTRLYPACAEAFSRVASERYPFSAGAAKGLHMRRT